MTVPVPAIATEPSQSQSQAQPLAFRELSREESLGLGLPLPAGAIMMGAVADGRIIAALGAFPVVFLDPLWVAPDRRKSSEIPGTLRGLWAAMRERLRLVGIAAVVAHADGSQPRMARLLARLKGWEVTGKREFLLLVD